MTPVEVGSAWVHRLRGEMTCLVLITRREYRSASGGLLEHECWVGRVVFDVNSPAYEGTDVSYTPHHLNRVFERIG